MAKNPFKKQSIMDTVVNVGVGGAANVAIDYVVNQVDAVKSLGETTINAGKIVLGAVLGSMVSNKMLRAACDGVAVVGASNLVSGLLGDTTPAGTAGLPHGTIGRVRPGNAAYSRIRRSRVSGISQAGGVMSK